jgi:hypothetical protein
VLYDGISVFDSVQAIYDTDTRLRAIGNRLSGTIVELRMPDGAAVQRYKTGGPGHWTLVGDADVLLRCVVRSAGVV